MKKNLLYCLLILLLQAPALAQKLYINEFMASNQSAVADPHFNEYPDWIEIYNSETYPVNLKGYSVTDNLDNPVKYVFADDEYIPAGGFLIIWADERDSGLHTNFKLSNSGESIGLFNSVGAVIDSITYSEQLPDVSLGRWPDGGVEWIKFYPSTPASANDSEYIYNKLEEPIVLLKGGFYPVPQLVTVTHINPEAAIYYTTDGTTPTTNSMLYVSPIQVDSITPLTVKAFREGYTPSNSIVNTYFIDYQTQLPVFSLVTDPANFFSDTSGIYVTGTNGITGNCSSIPRNWNQDWERPINLELFERDRTSGFNVKTGVKIYGSCSRLYDAKSLAIYFRSSYGFDRLYYRLFNDIPVSSFNNFLLRTAGQDWYRTLIREGMVHNLVKLGTKVGYQEYRPSLLFINGQYWGVHNIREKLNDHYLNSHYGVDINNIDVVEISKGIFVNNGDLDAYNSMINFLSTNNMSLPESYNYIKSIVDIDDYIDYQSIQIYAANGDWPGSNMKLWRERTPAGKWRWLVYDMDFTFGGNGRGMFNTNTLLQATALNGPDWPNPPWSTLMFRKLLQNNEFRNEFIQTFAVHMNTTFEPAHVKHIIDSLAAVVESEIPRQKQRWVKTISIGPDWYVNVQLMRDFADLRQEEVKNHFFSYFNISGSYSLIINRNNAAWGKVLIHDHEVRKYSSGNFFFSNIPLRVRAHPMPGYRFVRWRGADTTANPVITITRSQNFYLTAVFEPSELNVTTPVINEINYNSAAVFDTEDWIELYNPVQAEADLTGWKLMDDAGNEFIFPSGTLLPGSSYAVICRDTIKFNSLHLNVKHIYGNIGFGLSSSGDIIKLLNAEGLLIDSVKYSNSGEWPERPNGTGATLALVNPQYDNSVSLNWRASELYGTPGRLNDTYSENNDIEAEPLSFQLYSNYPNPFNPSTTIRYSIPGGEVFRITLKVFDILGREAAVLVNEEKSGGTYEANWNAEGFTSGIYFYQLQSDQNVLIKKMLLLK